MNRSRPFGNEPGHPVQEELHLPILRLREELESLQREIESGAGGGDPGVVIGRKAMVGAGAVVVADVPDGAVVVGNPAKIIQWVE